MTTDMPAALPDEEKLRLEQAVAMMKTREAQAAQAGREARDAARPATLAREARGGEPRGLDGMDTFLARHMPRHVHEQWIREGRPQVRYDDDPVEVRRQTDALQKEHRINRWREFRPSRFAEAQVRDLAPAPGVSKEESAAAWGRMQRILAWLDSDSPTLLLPGDPGTGKTHAAVAAGNALVDRPRPAWVEFWTAINLNDQLRPSYKHAQQVYAWAIGADVVIIDDAGREKRSEWTLERWQEILDHRWRERKRLILTTNLPYDDQGFTWAPYTDEQRANGKAPNLLDHYGPAIVDRMLDGATVVPFRGQSRRAPAPW